MSGAASLPAFAHDWVGGDIRGLSALAGQCLRIAPQISRADSALTTQADDLTCTAGWQGAAASAFSGSWAKDSAAGRQLVSAWAQIGGVVDVLAAELAALENVLERAAAEVESAGLVIDPGTGIPEPTVTAAADPLRRGLIGCWGSTGSSARRSCFRQRSRVRRPRVACRH